VNGAGGLTDLAHFGSQHGLDERMLTAYHQPQTVMFDH
jgi:hypothetical protein